MRFLILSIALALAAAGCTHATQPPQHPAPGDTGPIVPVEVSDEAFGKSAYQVLFSGERSADRGGLLVGVVRRQLARAGARFRAGKQARGLAALTGALYLCRAGELRPEMLAGAGDALRPAADEVARLGNEGKAAALYAMLDGLLPKGSKDAADVKAHLGDLDRWAQATRGSGPMRRAGAEQRAAVDRALFDPTPTALEAARRSTVAWLGRAMAYDIEDLPLRTQAERDEAIEAYRAIRAGGATLVALYLRHGDPGGAIAAIDGGDVGRVVPPGLRERLERVTDDGDPEAWAELVRLFEAAESPERPETALDSELARAAGWGSALQLYRAEPNSPRGAITLARLLLRYDLAEAAPHVLTGALAGQPGPRETSAALGVVLEAIADLDEAGDVPGAERTFAAAAPVLAIAESKPLIGSVRPSAARLRFALASIETRSANLTAAREHAAAAAQAEPSFEALTLLAAIDRQSGATDEALASLASAALLAKKAGDAAAESEALLASVEILRDAGRSTEAVAALSAALTRTLDARQLARNAAQQGRSERLLARALELYGDLDGARRATERAYEAGGSDARQLTATILDSARRGLTRKDLRSTKDALRRAIEADLGAEDLVYVALWQLLLERKLNLASDGGVGEAFASIEDASGWPAKLRAWATGKLDDAGLAAAARTESERTEAAFYAALGEDARGGSAGDHLAAVARSAAIELVEVGIARDIVATTKGWSAPKVPEGISLP